VRKICAKKRNKRLEDAKPFEKMMGFLENHELTLL
jgi:hypothetical protein